jgi:hypothetical protein
MAGAVVPPVAPVSPDLSGGAPHFSAKLGAWRKPLVSAKTPRSGFRFPAAKRRPGGVTLNQRVKWWIACLIWNLAMWGVLAWVWASFFHAGDQS